MRFPVPFTRLRDIHSTAGSSAGVKTGRTEGAQWKGVALWLAILGTAYAVRLHEIDQQSLWPDEIYSYDVSFWSVIDQWTRIVHDHVPLYTLLLGPWRSLTGGSALSLRYFSLAFSMLAVALSAAVTRQVLNNGGAYAVGALTALSPFQVYYAQELVTYSFLGSLSLMSGWVFLRWLSNPPRRILAIQTVLYGLLLYTHAAGLLVLSTHAGIVVTSRFLGRRDVRSRFAMFEANPPLVSWAWFISVGGGIALYVPWALDHVGSIAPNLAGGTSHSLSNLVNIGLIDLTFGYAVLNHLNSDSVGDALGRQTLGLAAAVVALSIVLALIPRRDVTGLRRFRWSASVAVLNFLIPFVILFVLVQFTREYATRYGYPGVPWFTIVAVVGLWSLRGLLRWAGVLILAGFAVWGLLLYFENPRFTRLDFRDAVAFVTDHYRPGDAILVTAPYVASTVDFYGSNRRLVPPAIPIPATVPGDDESTKALLADVEAHASRIWLVRWQDYFSDPTGVIGGQLSGVATREVERDWDGGLSVDLWLPRPPIEAAVLASAQATTSPLDNRVTLEGYQLDSDWPNTLRLTLYWRLAAPLTNDYTVFVHLIKGDSTIVAQRDQQPWDGQYPTSRWPVGVLIRDVHELTVGECLAPGQYRAEVGLYLLATMQRIGSNGSDVLQLPVVARSILRGPGEGRWLHLLPPALRLDAQSSQVPALGC